MVDTIPLKVKLILDTTSLEGSMSGAVLKNVKSGNAGGGVAGAGETGSVLKKSGEFLKDISQTLVRMLKLGGIMGIITNIVNIVMALGTILMNAGILIPVLATIFGLLLGLILVKNKDKIIGFVKDSLGKIGDIIGGIGDFGVGLAVGGFKMLADAVKIVIDFIGKLEFLKPVIDAVAGAVSTVVGWVQTFVNIVNTYVIDPAKNIFKSAVGFVQGLIDKVGELIKKSLEYIGITNNFKGGGGEFGGVGVSGSWGEPAPKPKTTSDLGMFQGGVRWTTYKMGLTN